MSNSKEPYDVGYGKPPTATRYRKGQLGNPRGRPKGTKNFEKLLEPGSKASPLIRERALFGLARCLEATCEGDTAQAIAQYRKLVSDFPRGVYEVYAKDRIEALWPARRHTPFDLGLRLRDCRGGQRRTRQSDASARDECSAPHRRPPSQWRIFR